MIYTTEQKVRMSEKIRVYSRPGFGQPTSGASLEKSCVHGEADEVIHETHESQTHLMFVSCRFVCFVDKPSQAC